RIGGRGSIHAQAIPHGLQSQFGGRSRSLLTDGFASNLNPHVVPPNLAPKPVRRGSPDRRASPCLELESPAVEGTDYLPVLDPPMPQRTVFVRTPAVQGVEPSGIAEDRDPKSLDVDRQS